MACSFSPGGSFILRRAPEALFALIAFVTGGVFFSGYVHLFHIYGMFYVPVILVLGTLLRLYCSDTFDKREVWFAVIATLLAFWHPFATALFVGFDFGFYLDTFWLRSIAQHVQALVILLVGTSLSRHAVCSTFLARCARATCGDRDLPLGTRLFGFLVSYQTNEINRAASLMAFLLTG